MKILVLYAYGQNRNWLLAEYFSSKGFVVDYADYNEVNY